MEVAALGTEMVVGLEFLRLVLYSSTHVDTNVNGSMGKAVSATR